MNHRQPSPGALDGLRVLDFTRVLAGPFCTMLLADFGADVIKVERPGSGDDTRQWGPPWAGEGENRQSAYYLSVNRNKRSVTLNLKTHEGRDLAKRLALQSDVLIENFKVGQMQHYGLDFNTLHALHPGLVYCSITGYGQAGPDAHRPGYDFAIQGQSGLMSITGPVDGEAHKVGVAISDVITGLFACNSIQAALHHRDKTGDGQHIDIALLDSQIAALVNVASNFLVSGQTPGRYGNAHPSIVPYQTFVAKDKAFALAVGNDAQFRRCCEVIGKPELADDPRFTTNPARVQNRDLLLDQLQAAFLKRTARDWVEAMLEVGVPASEINTIPEALNEPQVQSRGYVQHVTLTDGTPINLLGPTPKLSHTPPEITLPPPLLGQHTDEVFAEVLDLDTATIEDYRQRGII